MATMKNAIVTRRPRRNSPGIVCNKEIIALYPTLESNDIASATPNLLMCLLRLELSHRLSAHSAALVRCGYESRLSSPLRWITSRGLSVGSRCCLPGMPVQICVASFNERPFEIPPGKTGHADGQGQRQHRYAHSLSVENLRRSVENQSVHQQVKRVVEDVHAIRNRTQPPEHRESHSLRNPASLLRQRQHQKTSVEQRHPCISDRRAYQRRWM